MTEFTTWRSLVDGAEIRAIPDAEVYLHDDWGDNKLQDRDDSGTTTHNGVEGVYRPEWGQVDGRDLPSVDDEKLVKQSEEALQTDVNINLDETVTWEFNGVDLTDAGEDGDNSRVAYWHLFSETLDLSADDLKQSYLIRISGDINVELEEVDSNGDTTAIITGKELDTEIYDLKVERSPSGEWEIFVDDESQGTATDTSHTDPQYVAITNQGGEFGTQRYDELKIF